MIRIERSGDMAVVALSGFSDEALKTVKSIKPHHWHPSLRCWEVPSNAVDHLARRLYALGEGVFVDGCGYDPLAAAEAQNPFVPLMAALPEHLQDRVFNSLVEVFATVDGDDGVLFQQLCDAVLLIQQQAKVAAKAEARAAQPKKKPPRQTPTNPKPVRTLIRRAAS